MALCLLELLANTELVLTFLGSRSDVVNEKIVDPPGSQADYDQTILTKTC